MVSGRWQITPLILGPEPVKVVGTAVPSVTPSSMVWPTILRMNWFPMKHPTLVGGWDWCSSTDQKRHTCAFFSRHLSPAERNYDIGNRELLAFTSYTLLNSLY